MTKTKFNALLATTAVLALAACGSSSTPKVEKPPVEGEEFVNAGGVTLTAKRVYDNGALLSTVEDDSVSGSVYISDGNLARKFPSSDVSEDSNQALGGSVFDVSAETNEIKSVGGRFVLVLPNDEGFAAAQLVDINDGSAIQNSVFGTSVTQMPSGTATYSNAGDIGYARIRGEGSQANLREFMDFELVVNFDKGSANLSTSDSDYQMTASNITVNTTTGAMFSDQASIGLKTDPMAANMSGYIVGTNGGAVTGIVNSTDAAIPTLHGQFVGLKQP